MFTSSLIIIGNMKRIYNHLSSKMVYVKFRLLINKVDTKIIFTCYFNYNQSVRDLMGPTTAI